MPLIAYTATAGILLWLAHRCVRAVSRRAAILLYLLPFAFCGFALIANRVYAPIDLPYEMPPLQQLKAQYGIENVSTGMHTDVYTEFIPWRHAVKRSLVRGEWGLWNPYSMSGDLLLASQQAAVYSPLTLIACLMPVALSFTFTAAITFFIAALCAFLLAREFGCGEASALMAAAGWAFCTPITLFLLVTMGQTWVWCPLLLIAVARIVELPSLRNAALLAFAFTAILMSGHPESAALCVVVGLFYGVFETLRRRTFVRPALFATGAGVVALMLSAVHTLPFLEALPHSHEQQSREVIFADMGSVATWRVSLARIVTTLFPYLHERQWNLPDYPPHILKLEIGAVGSVILALALFAVIRVRTSTTWFLGGLAVVSLLAHAEWQPVVAVFRAVPVLEIVLTDRLSFSFALCCALLAAIAVEKLVRDDNRRAAALTLAATLLVVIAGNFWAMRTPLVQHIPLKFGQYKVAAEVTALAAAVVVVLFSRLARFAPALLLGLVIAQRVVSDGGMYHSFSERQAYPPVPLFGSIDRGGEPFRVVGHGQLLTPQTNTFYDLEEPRGVPSLILQRYLETYSLWCVAQPVWFNRIDDLTRPFLSFLNIRYAISASPAPPGWRQVAFDRGTYLHENTRVLPRAFVPAYVSAGYPRVWNLVDLLKETDFASRAWIEAPMTPSAGPNGPGTLRIAERRLGYVIEAKMENEGWIVASIPRWPGWRATVDGKAVPTRFANHAFLGVFVPKGQHTVRLMYWPASFVWGASLSGGTLLGIVVAAFVARRRNRATGASGSSGAAGS